MKEFQLCVAVPRHLELECIGKLAACFFPLQFSRVLLGKEYNETEIDRRRWALGDKHPDVWSKSTFLDMRSSVATWCQGM